MVKKKLCNILLIVLIGLVFLMSGFVSAQTGSLAVWENIADGTLINTWSETTDANWKGQNVSGVWSYNCTTTDLNWTYNASIPGDRWFNTWEITSDDAETGIGSIQTVDGLQFYGVVYYLDGSDHGTGGECYIVYYDVDTMYYWNDTGFETNISNATDYAGQEEIDFYNGYIRVKSLWNWNRNNDTNVTIRFKLWDPTSDEPTTWMVDADVPYFPDDTNSSFYSGMMVDAQYTASGSTNLFRRIFFWNLSFDYDTRYHTANQQIPYIGCPQYDADDLFTLISDFTGEDFYNYTQFFKTMINLWDLTSFYDINDPSKTGAQNDTIYVFSILTTGWEDFFEEYFEFEYPGDIFPNNILIFYIYETIDGTPPNGDPFTPWNDSCAIRFDFNNDGYTADDYTFVLRGTAGGTLYGYHGWTAVIPDSPSEWYGQGNIYEQYDDAQWGRVFRDYNYSSYVFFLNWDLISGSTDAGEPVNISIGFFDNESDNFCLWQDWDEENDTVPLTPASDNQTWSENNNTALWGIFEIRGSSLDFEDPIQLHGIEGEIATNYIPIIFALAMIVTFLGLVLTGNITAQNLIYFTIVAIIVVITIQIITGF